MTLLIYLIKKAIFFSIKYYPHAQIIVKLVPPHQPNFALLAMSHLIFRFFITIPVWIFVQLTHFKL